jgi:hypothetical protein
MWLPGLAQPERQGDCWIQQLEPKFSEPQVLLELEQPALELPSLAVPAREQDPGVSRAVWPPQLTRSWQVQELQLQQPEPPPHERHPSVHLRVCH